MKVKIDRSLTVETSEVLWCTADSNYTEIKTVKVIHIVTKSLGKVEKLLGTGFTRVNRSLLVKNTQIENQNHQYYIIRGMGHVAIPRRKRNPKNGKIYNEGKE